ncbi:hypothetical protein MJO28_000200 [Puccinia striiformis f. sp. tritici]|uniref:Uncharacterized protein n=1 Tax=Puccinia striiformis f. sp. tritici TaxID=168172 RepID=A0ACC0EYA6_9BASI|nr:hypothetical protein Pst134EA_001015 [Puccinia striiformis f. sp. tritici]KAI9600016.1 hypothetical protein KEM48_000230 [Puccinia striiformis f. sp. tritici PST-130]KAH9467204.1 hypothetical protein Pst134EB_002227 [Puccinia striiformis f. sp. tritici]KAH9473960.1 hypothetical protein Pst134EA_001015 [Puccinia striiformis f. sp. tritici]KAI7962106.1 hypothetical protein MJO28_000200 [Puccinia striiformis f. sp. tritici]KAI7967748.1 hypothetical protein MJO29_001025 [Puccinia striiformis f.
MNPPWSVDSWRLKPITQDITYPSETLPKLEHVKTKLKNLPGLVTPQEIMRLKERLKLVGRGESFLLHGGDCAELFEYCNHEHISARVKLLLMMSLIIIWGARIPVVRVGRIAGQFAKPRSQPTEVIDGKEYHSFRGDIVNGYGLDERTPDPERLLLAYFHSSAIINHIRGLLGSGLADLQRPSAWSFAHVRSPSLQAKFQDIVSRLEDSLDFMRTIGAANQSSTLGILDTVEIWTSHEALLLEYEEALTRTIQPERSARARKISSVTSGVEIPKKETIPSEGSSSRQDPSQDSGAPSYDLSAHLVWVGERTRQIDHAHLEFLRGISNPIGVKLGPKTTPEDLLSILDILNPNYEEGKILLICRFGAEHVDRCLPPCINAVLNSKHHRSIFCCDPMHGNTKTAEGLNGIKTRYLGDVISELTKSITIHAENHSRLGGVHLEMTGELDPDGYSVTECLGGSMNLKTEHLSLNYQTHCDPRLNYEQSLDIAFLIANQFHALRNDSIIKPDSILPELT